MKLSALLSALTFIAATSFAQTAPPAGFVALFNGKDLEGWRGGDTHDPRALAAMPVEKREALVKKWTDDMLKLDPSVLVKIIRLGARIQRFLSVSGSKPNRPTLKDPAKAEGATA